MSLRMRFYVVVLQEPVPYPTRWRVRLLPGDVREDHPRPSRIPLHFPVAKTNAGAFNGLNPGGSPSDLVITAPSRLPRTRNVPVASE